MRFKKLIPMMILCLLMTGSLTGLCCRTPHGCNKEKGVILHLEGLYWTIAQDSLDFAVEFDDDDDHILGPGDTKFVDYDWKGGGRGHLGFRWCGWDVQGVYTWYENDVVKHESGLFKAALVHPASLEVDATEARAESAITYQTADILFGRDLCLCENSLVLHPFFGARGLSIEQDLKARYSGEDFVDPIRVNWESELRAIGLLAGLNMDYRWWCGFGLYGSFSGSVLYSKTDIHHKQETLDGDGDVVSQEIDLKNKEHVTVPAYHLSAGISWDGCCGTCFYYIFKVGYEFNHWFNTPQLRRYRSGNEGVSSDSSGNIGFHGGVLSLKILF